MTGRSSLLKLGIKPSVRRYRESSSNVWHVILQDTFRMSWSKSIGSKISSNAALP